MYIFEKKNWQNYIWMKLNRNTCTEKIKHKEKLIHQKNYFYSGVFCRDVATPPLLIIFDFETADMPVSGEDKIKNN